MNWMHITVSLSHMGFVLHSTWKEILSAMRYHCIMLESRDSGKAEPAWFCALRQLYIINQIRLNPIQQHKRKTLIYAHTMISLALASLLALDEVGGRVLDLSVQFPPIKRLDSGKSQLVCRCLKARATLIQAGI